MPLAPFAQVDRSAFGWLRSRDHPAGFTLSSGQQPVAQLDWPAVGSSPVALETADGRGSLDRAGFLGPRIVLRGPAVGDGPGPVLAQAEHHVVHLADGSSYRIHRAHLLVPAWKISDSLGAEVAHLEPVADGRRLAAGAVVVATGCADLPGLLPLLVVAWYFLALVWFEDEVAEVFPL